MLVLTLDIIGNKHKVRKKARSNKEIDVFQGIIADFPRYLGFSQAIELFPIMSKEVCHSRESGNPEHSGLSGKWIPAFAGMTTL